MTDKSCLGASALAMFGDDGIPRVFDLIVAEALGFRRPRDIRKLIKRHEAELSRYGCIVCRDFSGEARHGGAPPGIPSDPGYWFNEPQAILLAILSQTAAAADVRQQLIEAFEKYRERSDANSKLLRANQRVLDAEGQEWERLENKLRHARYQNAQLGERIDQLQDQLRSLREWIGSARLLGYEP